MKKIKVGISEFPPLVFKKRNTLEGFELDLWNKVASLLDFKVDEIQTYKFSNLLDKVKDGEIDVAFAGITKTENRERFIDFSHSSFNSGLHIMVRKDKKKSILQSLSFRKLAKIVTYFVTFVFIFSNLIWFFERGHSISGSYIDGIFQSVWWLIVTVSTVGYGDISPETFLGRLVGVVTILAGLSLFSLLIAQLSSSITISKMRGFISKPHELEGLSVSTVKGSHSVKILQDLGANIKEYATIEDSVKSLKKGEVTALVFDAPVLLYYAKKDPDVIVSGEKFDPQEYGFVFQDKSSIRESFNRALLHLHESGEYDRLYVKWFGKKG